MDMSIIGLLSSAMTGIVFLIYASGAGLQIIRNWDIANGDEGQLILERKTSLISIVLYYVMFCEFFSLFLFVFIAEEIHTLFVGAMCAAGTLNINMFGYPVLAVKLMNFLLCGIWIIINYVDNKGYDYPLIRLKYKFLIVITLLVILETALLFGYFTRLAPEVITSCCGTIFSEGSGNIADLIITLPPWETKILFYLVLFMTFATGLYFHFQKRMAVIFSCFSVLMLPLGLAAVLSFISVYFYQQPTHHCPFCLLKKEYFHVGYILYPALFIASVFCAGTGIINCFRNKLSIREIVPNIQKRLCGISIIGYAVFAAIATYPILFSDFKLP